MTPNVKDEIRLRASLVADDLHARRAARSLKFDVSDETQINGILMSYTAEIILLDAKTGLSKFEFSGIAEGRTLPGPNEFCPSLDTAQSFDRCLCRLEGFEFVEQSMSMSNFIDSDIDEILFRQQSYQFSGDVIVDERLLIFRKITIFGDELCDSFLVPFCISKSANG